MTMQNRQKSNVKKIKSVMDETFFILVIRQCFPAYRYCVKSKIIYQISNLTVHQQQKKCPNSMSEVNVHKWYEFIISSHFQAKKDTLKSSWKQLWYLDIFTQPVPVDLDRFLFLFVTNLVNGDPLWLHCGIYGKPLEYKLYFHWSIRDDVGSQCRIVHQYTQHINVDIL